MTVLTTGTVKRYNEQDLRTAEATGDPEAVMAITAYCLINEPDGVDPTWAVVVRQAHARALARLARSSNTAETARTLCEEALVYLTRVVQLTEEGPLTAMHVVGTLDMVYTLVLLYRHDEAAALMWKIFDRIAAAPSNREFVAYYNAMKDQIARLAARQNGTRP